MDMTIVHVGRSLGFQDDNICTPTDVADVLVELKRATFVRDLPPGEMSEKDCRTAQQMIHNTMRHHGLDPDQLGV